MIGSLAALSGRGGAILSKIALVLLVAIGLSATESKATFIQLVDFQSDTVGGDPGDADLIIEPSGTVLEVVCSGSNPVDPSGGPGNQSLLLEDTTAGGEVGAHFSHPEGSGPITAGTASIDFYRVADAVFPNSFLNLFFPDGSFGGVNIYITADNSIFVYDETFHLLDQTQSPNTAHSLDVVFDTATAGALSCRFFT